jgi:hypothetical protein
VALLLVLGSATSCGTSSSQDGGLDGAKDGSHDGGSDTVTKPEVGPTEGGCGSGETMCGGSCVNEKTDPNHCGGCGLKCNTKCNAGQCIETLVSLGADDGPWVIAVDATSLYWTSQGRCGGEGGASSGTVMKMALDGSGQMTLASGQDQPIAIAVDKTSVYWVNQCAGKGAVLKESLTGGSPVTLATGLDRPANIALDATSVYFTTADAVLSIPLDGVVEGGAPTTLASGQGASAGVGVEGATVYFGGGKPPNIKSVPSAGGKVTNLTPKTACDVPYCASVGGLTTDAHDAYWSALMLGGYSTSAVSAMKLSGGVPDDLDDDQGIVANLASDGTNLYWTTYANAPGYGDVNTVEKVSVAGGAPTTIAANQHAPRGIAVDATSVYWANSGSPSSIMKSTPK